jgi:hypothetical protein
LSVKFIYSDRIEKLDSSKYSLLAFTTFSDDHKATKFTVFIKKPPNHNVKAVEIYGEYSCTTSQKLVSKTIKNVELKTGTKLDVGITTASIERASDTDLVFHSDQKFRLINKVELYYPQGILLTGKDGGSSYSQNKLRQWYKFGSIPKMADLNFEYFKDTNSAKIPFKLLINSPI